MSGLGTLSKCLMGLRMSLAEQEGIQTATA